MKVDWNKRFFDLATYIGGWSKDTTKVGAVIADYKNSVVSVGYNGYPRNSNDEFPGRNERPTKYFFTVHAEANAVSDAARKGVSLNDCTIYVTLFPCSDCAKLIIQSGIKKVIAPEPDFNNVMWGEHFKCAQKMFEECNVDVKFI